MSGETNLATLLTGMSPQRRPGRFVFVTVQDGTMDADVLASVVEPEGLSVVVTQDDADRLKLTYDYVAGWITLQVHSALAAVGLTAAVSTALAEADISCNVIAGYHHDHLLVPIDRLDDALDVLRRLAEDATRALAVLTRDGRPDVHFGSEGAVRGRLMPMTAVPLGDAKPSMRASPTPPPAASRTTVNSSPGTGSLDWRSGTRSESRLEPNVIYSGCPRRSPLPVSSSSSGLSLTIHGEWASLSAANLAACALLAVVTTG